MDEIKKQIDNFETMVKDTDKKERKDLVNRYHFQDEEEKELRKELQKAISKKWDEIKKKSKRMDEIKKELEKKMDEIKKESEKK